MAHHNWIPLWLAPFHYRYDPGLDGPELPNGYSDKELEALLRGGGICDAKIDAEAGEFELSFRANVASPFNFPLRFHPVDFPAEQIRHPEVRASTAENVERAWSIMKEDFCCAVAAKRCAVFGRAVKLSNPLTLVAPDVFNQMVEIDWLKNRAQAKSGETFYSLHAAPLHAANEVAAALQRQVHESNWTCFRKMESTLIAQEDLHGPHTLYKRVPR